jgi:hypothetical protein
MAAATLPAASAAKTAKVKKAVSTPGAKGAKGFMLWAQAALSDQPKVLSAVVTAAKKHVPSTSPGIGSFAFLGRAPAKFRRLSSFGQTGMTGGSGYGSTGGNFGVTGGTGSTAATVSGTPSTAGSSAWANDILGAVTAAGAAATTVTAIKANLSAAQQGLAPVAYVSGVTGGVAVAAAPIFGIPSTLFWMLALGGGALLLITESQKKR